MCFSASVQTTNCIQTKDTMSHEQLFPYGTFDLVPAEMRSEIFEKLIANKDWETLIQAANVNWSWKEEIDFLWRKYCEKHDLLVDEAIWNKSGRNWKWICVCLSKVFQQDEMKDGVGCTPKNPQAKVLEARYEGEFKDNKKHGVGRVWWSNGDRYVGEWRNDCKQGFGYMMWENGDRYEGTWTRDLRDGSNAKYNYSNGGLFEGTYLSDERHGPGAFIWPDGDRFEGTWKAGGRTGTGVLILANGTKIEQEWNESPYVNYSEGLPSKYPSSEHPEVGSS